MKLGSVCSKNEIVTTDLSAASTMHFMSFCSVLMWSNYKTGLFSLSVCLIKKETNKMITI